MNCDVDALIIGGGPAGATTALLLARAGWSVAIIEKKSFPRVKVCGEFISATSSPLLQELNILDYFNHHAGPPVQRVGWFVNKQMLTAKMPPVTNSIMKWGRALGREHLDTVLLNAARESGVKVWQPWSAREVIDRGDHFICNIGSKDEKGQISAPLVIIAHGSWESSVIKQQKGIHKDSDLLAFKAHFINSSLDPDLMSLFSFPGGYGGLVHSDEKRITLSCCVRRNYLQKIRAASPGLQAGDVVLNYIRSHCYGVDNVLSSAQQHDPWLSVGPLCPGIRDCYQEGIFYVGNMAGEAHPIIAEGISMAMQSGWLLAKCLIGNELKLNRSHLSLVGEEYTKKWQKQFRNRIRAAAFFAQITTRPQLVATVLPLVKRFPGLLTFSAALSGKVKKLK